MNVEIFFVGPSKEEALSGSWNATVNAQYPVVFSTEEEVERYLDRARWLTSRRLKVYRAYAYVQESDLEEMVYP